MKKNLKSMFLSNRIVVLGFLFGGAYWLVETIMHYTLFGKESFMLALVPHQANEMWMRSFVVCMFIGFSIYVNIAVATLRKIQDKLKASLEAQKIAENQMKRHRLEVAHVSRLTTISEMASSIAHELNQPLFAMQAHAERCSKLLVTGSYDTKDLIRKMDTIVNQAERSSEILSRIRTFTKKSGWHKKRVSICNIISEALSFLEIEIKRKNIKIKIDIENDEMRLLADPIQIEQVILNLLQNGIDAMEEIPIDQRQLIIKTNQPFESVVKVSFKDVGIGIAKENLANVFNSFYTTKPKGLGIGLSISRSIIEAHSGKLKLEPNSDRGITAYFTLPLMEVF